MKILVAIITSCLSFFYGKEPTANTICGVWKGSYGSEKEIIDITVKIDPQNKVEFFREDAADFKASGTYKLLGDSAIIISCKVAERKSIEITMYGNLNRSISFIDGQWDDDKEKGCFFLQKQPLSPNL